MTRFPKLTILTGTAIAVLFAFIIAAGAAENISVKQAYELASKGEIVLVDIRSREEWRETGIASVARPISMHEKGFFQKLDQAIDGARDRAVALICATGGRSAWLQIQLTARGYSHIINVPEGMLGGRYGPGWIKSGLPVAPFSGN